MALTAGLFSNSLDTTFADARRDLEGAVVRDTAGKMRAGIFYNRDTSILTARADMRLNIGDFRAVLDCDGAVFIGNAGTMQSPVFGAAPSANRRIDTLILVQPINPDGATGKPFFEVVQGVASPTPVAPSIPANRDDALVFADVEIPASATSMQSSGVIITPRFAYTAMAGGTVYVRNPVEMAAWTPADGARVFNLSDKTEYVRNAGVWEGPNQAWVDLGKPSGQGSVEYSRDGRLIIVQFQVTRTMPASASTTISSTPIPLEDRPQDGQAPRGIAVGGGYAMFASVNADDGLVTVGNWTGAARPNASGTVTYFRRG